MDLYGIGFSNIRMPNSNNDYTYKFDYRINKGIHVRCCASMDTYQFLFRNVI